MKKLFPGILALLMAFGMMVGCGEKPADSSTPAGSTPPASTPDTSTPDDSTPDEDSPLYALESVKEVLNGSMIQKNVETRKDYTVANQWYSWHADETFDIAWTVTDAAGNATTNVTIVEGDGDYDTVKVNTDLSEDFTYILTGTISDSQGQSVQLSFTRKVLKAGEYLPVAITEKPAENTAYKLYVYQSTNAKDCYFTGDMDGYYFKTTEDESAAVELFVEYIAGGDNFNVYFMDASNVKQYIGVKLSADGAHDNIVFETTPSSSFAWNAELGTITTHLDVNKNGEAADYYLGNYSTHMTFSASMLSYAGGAGNNVGGLVTMVHKDDIKVPDADKIAAVKESLSVQLNHTLDKEVTLKTADDRYSDVSISWSVEADKGATVANDKLNLVIPAAATEVVLTATISCGDASEEVAFTLVLGPKTVAPDATNADAIIAAAYSLAAGETLPGGNYTLTGEITKVNTAWNDQYGNITVTITIGDKTFECYRLVSGAAEVNELKVGDVITVTGPIKNYNGKVEFDKGCVLDAIVEGEVGGGDDTPDTPDEPETPDTPAIQTLEIANIPSFVSDFADNTYSESKYYIIGKISSIDDTSKGIMYLTDANGNSLYVYCTYDSTGANAYGAMANPPHVGDTVKLLSVVGKYYNNVVQAKNAWIVEVTSATDAEKVAIEKDALTMDNTALGAKNITLAATGAVRPETTIVWEVTAGQDIASIVDGTLVITNPTAQTTVTVQATITCGQSVDSKTFDIVVSHLSDTLVSATESKSIAANQGSLNNKEITWTFDNFVCVGKQASSTTAIRTSDSDHYRIYQNSKFGVNGKDGAMISKVVFTITESKYVTPFVTSVTNAGYTATSNGNVVTITLDSPAASIEFTASAQTRINNIEVTYLK